MTLKKIYERFKPLAAFLNQKPQANKVFTNRVSPGRQAQTQASYQSPVSEGARGLVQPVVSIAQSLPRSGVAIGQTIRNDPRPFVAKNRFERNVFGTDPIQSGQSGQVSTYLQSKGVNPQVAALAGIGGLSAEVGSSFLPGSKNISQTAKLLAKTNKAEEVIKLLKAARMPTEARLVTQLVKETDPKKVEQLIKTKPVAKLPGGDEYLYHGTNKTSLENILKEGIVPQKRGVSSFSTDEAYSRNWADNPWTKTKGEMFRIKKEVLDGKLVKPKGSRPETDKQFELLTNQVVSPKDVEVKTAAGWRPLTDLYNEARGTKSVAPELPAPAVRPVPAAQADVLPRTQLSGRALDTPTAQLTGQQSAPSGTPVTRTIEPFERIITRTGGTNVREKVNLLDYIRTPDRVLKKIGLEKESVEIRRAYDGYVAELPEQIKKIDAWKSRVTPEGNLKIFKYLDGQIAKESLDPTELQVATEIRRELETWADRLQLPKDKRITNYITHIFDEDLIQKEFPDEIANIISDQVAGSVYDPFVTQRLGKLGYIEDTFQALEAYVKRATRKANLDPALEQVKRASEGLEQSQFKYVKQYIDRVNMRPTDIDSLVDNSIKSVFGYKAGVRPMANLSRQARQWIYRGTLGLNVSSALKNLSQGANTYARLGEKYTLKGYFDLVRNFQSDELVRVGVLKDDFIQDRTLSASKKSVQALDKGLFALFELAEKINRGAAYYGAKAQGLAKGLDEVEAIQYAKQIVRDTQFTFGSIDTPPVLQSDIGKTFGQFQSFTLKQGEFLGEMIAKKDLAGLTRWTGASLLFVYGIGEMFGMEPKDLIPSLRIGVPPALQLPADLAKSALGAKDQYGNDIKPVDVLKKDIIPLIPGGVQLKKSYEGYRAAERGYSESKNGQVRFPISQSTGSKIQNTVFGQYTSDDARNYFKTKAKPLSDKQSETFKADGGRDYYNQTLQQRADKKAGKETISTQSKTQADTLPRAQYAKDKAQLKREKDLGGLIDRTGRYIYILDDYIKTLDPVKDAAEIVRTEAEIDRLNAEMRKYGEQGGITKPKKAKKAKRTGRGKRTGGRAVVARNKTKIRTAYSIAKPKTNKFTFKARTNTRSVKPATNFFSDRTSRIGFSGTVRKPNSSVSRPSRRPRVIGRPRNLV